MTELLNINNFIYNDTISNSDKCNFIEYYLNNHTMEISTSPSPSPSTLQLLAIYFQLKNNKKNLEINEMIGHLNNTELTIFFQIIFISFILFNIVDSCRLI